MGALCTEIPRYYNLTIFFLGFASFLAIFVKAQRAALDTRSLERFVSLRRLVEPVVATYRGPICRFHVGLVHRIISVPDVALGLKRAHQCRSHRESAIEDLVPDVKMGGAPSF